MAKDDSVKDGTTALIAAGAAVLTLTGPAGAAVAFASGVAAIAWDRLGSRNRRRAEQLFQQMTDGDEDPTAFIDMINRRLLIDDEEVFVALRLLLNATLDAISPAAMGAIAIIGRAYLRGKCSAPLARGWIRIISELTTSELAALRDVADAALAARAVGDDLMRRAPSLRVSEQPSGVAFLLSDQRPGGAKTLNAIPAVQGRGAEPVAAGYAERLFELMLRNGIGSERGNLIAQHRTRAITPDTRPAVELEHEAVEILVRAMERAHNAPGTME